MKLFNNAISPCVQIERERDIYLIALKMYNHSTDQVMETMESHPNSEFEVCCCVGPCGLQHARLPGPSPSPRVCSNSCPLSQWCHPTISYSVAPFSFCLQSFPASGSFLIGQSIGVSAAISVLAMNTQDWSLSGWTSLISLQSEGLSRVFSNTTVQKH